MNICGRLLVTLSGNDGNEKLKGGDFGNRVEVIVNEGRDQKRFVQTYFPGLSPADSPA